MAKHKVLAVPTEFWRPKEDYLERIVEGIRDRIGDEDFLVVSEKAISTALGNIVDESAVRPSAFTLLIARFWMRIAWGYFFGFLCHFPKRLIQRLRSYPIVSGGRHKLVALTRAGLLQTLMFGSEGGIDGSNLPYSYVSLPLENPQIVAQEIREHIRLKLHRKVCVMITDTDKTYSFRNFHFTPRPRPMVGIHSFGGFAAYVIGRMFGLKRNSTPLAVAGCNMPVEEALEMAEITNRVRGSGAGRTVWEMAERFDVDLTGVSWEMLETVKHKPIVIVKSKR
jgi:F420-0:gamma-glutamyl ligase-like protein